MFTAMILVCATTFLNADGHCPAENAVWTAESPPNLFSTEDNCLQGARNQIQNRIDEIREVLDPKQMYNIDVTCKGEPSQSEAPIEKIPENLQLPPGHPPIPDHPVIEMPKHK